MTTIAFDSAAFRVAFPFFADQQCFSDATLSGFFAIGSQYVTNTDSSCYVVNGDSRVLACNLMTAHVGFMYNAAAKGLPTGVIIQATVDKISVMAKSPEIQKGSMFQYWLAQSPYGQQLLALLGMAAAGGLYIGGSPVRASFRGLRGGFG